MRPFGYAPDRVTVDPAEAEIIRDAAARLLDGGTLRGVSRELNDRGSRTSAGKEWQPLTLRRVMLSPRIAGLVEGKRRGHYRKASWEPILDEMTWRRLREVLDDPARKKSPDANARTYLLTGGLAVCGLCSTALVSRPDNQGKRGYVCRSGPPSNGCGRIRVNAEALEDYVGMNVCARLVSVEDWTRLMTASKAMAEGADGRIKVFQERLAELGRDYGDGLVDRAAFLAGQKRIKQRIAEEQENLAMASRIDDIEGSEGWAPDLLALWWNAADMSHRRDLVELLLHRVEVHPVTNRGSRIFDPERVRLVWR